MHNSDLLPSLLFEINQNQLPGQDGRGETGENFQGSAGQGGAEEVARA
jgi:hypothetical protein